MNDEAAIERPTEVAELADDQARLLDLLHDSLGRVHPERPRVRGPFDGKLDQLDPALLEIATDLTRSTEGLD